jgi:hypothetical protein
MNKALKIAVILSAVDNMSAVVKSAFGNLQSQYLKGSTMIAAGIGVGKAMENFTEDFKNLEDAAIKTKIAMMREGGLFDQAMLTKVTNFATDLASQYGNTTANYLDMVRIMKNNRLTENDIMGGAGDAVAQFAELYNVLPAEAASFASKMKNDMKIPAEEIGQMLDMASRLHGSGVGKTGTEAIYDLTEFYAKTALEAPSLGIHGLKDAQQLGILGSLFMTKGLTGQTTGTNLSRIFNAMQDPAKVKQMEQIAASFGKNLDLGKNGKIDSIGKFVEELRKLNDLDPGQINKIMQPFGGLEGMDNRMLKFLGRFGEEYDHLYQRYSEQADMHDKVQVSLQALSMSQLRAERSWQNTRAALVAYNPELKKYYEYSKKAAENTKLFAEQHPTILKWATRIIFAGGAILILLGAFKIFMATMAYLAVVPMLSSIGFAVWALKYHIVTGLIPALHSMGLAWAGALGYAGALLATMYLMNDFLEGDKVKGDSFFGVSAIPVKLSRYFSGGSNSDTLSTNNIKPVASAGGGDSTIVYSPNMTFSGNVNKAELDKANEEAQRSFEKMMQQFTNDQKRRRFS